MIIIQCGNLLHQELANYLPLSGTGTGGNSNIELLTPTTITFSQQSDIETD